GDPRPAGDRAVSEGPRWQTVMPVPLRRQGPRLFSCRTGPLPPQGYTRVRSCSVGEALSAPAKAGAQTLFFWTGPLPTQGYTIEQMKAGFVYIMASGRNGTLYIGVTSDLVKRAWAHRNGVVPGFTRKHGCKLLVWYAAFDDLQEARRRELQM